jgi:hypothetical protein
MGGIKFRNEHIFKHLVQSDPSQANRQLAQRRHSTMLECGPRPYRIHLRSSWDLNRPSLDLPWLCRTDNHELR